MIIDPIQGLSASVRSIGQADGIRPGTLGASGGIGAEADFAAMLGEAIAGVGQKLREAEAVSIAGIRGMASTQDVVEAVVKAEQGLQAAIAIRDKIVSAYMEISRMSI